MNTPSSSETDFAPYFLAQRVDPVGDPDLMVRIQRLRFEVYCEECGFLPASDYPGGRESDSYDEASAHFCAIDRNGDLAGYVRLVPPDASGRLPFQDHCAALFETTRLPVPQDSGEVSRLMVPKRYRRRKNDTLAGVTVNTGEPTPDDRRSSTPQIMLSLYRQMYLYSVDNDVRYWYAAMERYLGRTLMLMGFAFEAIGPETDYYGPVAPYLADLRVLEERLAKGCPELLGWFRTREP